MKRFVSVVSLFAFALLASMVGSAYGTTIHPVEKECAICGTTSTQNEMGSTNSMGLPDLDTRPPEMMRSTMNLWIETCPSCGYCAPDITEKMGAAAEIVHRDAYKQQLSSTKFPKLANAFLCSSLIQEDDQEYVGAGWAAIHAAWACDDAGTDAAAVKCRKRAVTLLQKAKTSGQKLQEQAGAEEAILSDLLRRSGQFELADKTCDEGLKKEPEEIVSQVLRFQKALIGKSDVTCHTIAEATEYLGQQEEASGEE